MTITCYAVSSLRHYRIPTVGTSCPQTLFFSRQRCFY